MNAMDASLARILARTLEKTAGKTDLLEVIVKTVVDQYWVYSKPLQAFLMPPLRGPYFNSMQLFVSTAQIS